MADDPYLLSMLSTIEKHGWGLVHIGEGCSREGCTCEDDGEPPFTYTVGLTAMGHPELLVHGLPGASSAPLLNGLGERIRAGESFHDGQILACDHCDAEVVLLRVLDDSDLVVVGQIYPDVQALQVVWRDRRYRYPWEEGYDVRQFPQIVTGLPPVRAARL